MKSEYSRFGAKQIGICLLAGSGLLLTGDAATPQTNAAATQAAVDHDGRHDFDFEAGSWKIHLKKLQNPLSGSTTWVEFDGTTVTRKVWDGRAWLEEFEAEGPSGHVEGLTLRLYSPQSHQWSLFWANSKNGTLSQPTVGEFKNGRGEFYDQETYEGRYILVRYVWSERVNELCRRTHSIRLIAIEQTDRLPCL